MNSKMGDRVLDRILVRAIAAALGCLAVVAIWLTMEHGWLTPDQQGQRLLGENRYEEAAGRFRDPMWQGVALYKAAKFKEAATAFGRTTSTEAAFNRGNALVMAGKYEGAIASYDRALAERPDWTEAKENRAIAVVRQKRVAPSDDDYGGTGGKLAPDEIVFDDRPNQSSGEEQKVEVGAGGPMSDDEMRAIWLRRVETRPADFLRVKFSYQKAREDAKTRTKAEAKTE